MRKFKNNIEVIIKSNFIKYAGIFILNTIVIIDTVKIVISIINYITTKNNEYLVNITNCSVLISIAFTLSIYLIKNIKILPTDANVGRDK